MNKIKYGLRNVYIAKATYTEASGDTPASITYGTPVKHPGAVSLSLSKKGESTPSYADDMTYYTVTTNDGYEGDWEVMKTAKSFLKDFLGQQEDNNHVIIEGIDDVSSDFAMMFEIQGDQSGTRYVFYRCNATQSNFDAETKQDKTTPKTDKLSMKVMGRETDGIIKAFVEKDDNAAKYNAFFDAVYVPQFPATLKSLTIGSLMLSPTFASGTTSYTASTTNSSDLVVADATYSGAEIEVKLGDVVKVNGEAVTWASGSNTLTVEVTTGELTETYTVTVTKS